MATFIMLTRLNTDAVKSPQRLEQLERDVVRRIEKDCADVKWVGSYAVLGPYDYVDIFTAPDIDAAMRVSALVRTFGHAQTEVWAAAEWSRFKELVRSLPGEK